MGKHLKREGLRQNDSHGLLFALGGFSLLSVGDAVIKSIAIAEGLGSTSAYTWMKLPVVAEMERVMAATTMPTVLLGGDPEGTQDEVFATWEAALALPGVQGLTVGRTLLYPQDGDVAGAVATAASLLNHSASARTAEVSE